MFRLQDNVPEVYVKQSRDFQLFCRIYDVVNNAIRFNAKSAENLLDPLKVSDRMLPLLATRVGFFPKHEYNTYALREVISAFPYIIKYKGSKLGIEMALNVILKIENNYQESLVQIDTGNSRVNILTSTKLKGEDLLRDVLSYILPIGYEIVVSTFDKHDIDDKDRQLELGVTIIKEDLVNSQGVSVVVSPNDGDGRILGSYTTMQTVHAPLSEASDETIYPEENQNE